MNLGKSELKSAAQGTYTYKKQVSDGRDNYRFVCTNSKTIIDARAEKRAEASSFGGPDDRCKNDQGRQDISRPLS